MYIRKKKEKIEQMTETQETPRISNPVSDNSYSNRHKDLFCHGLTNKLERSTNF